MIGDASAARRLVVLRHGETDSNAAGIWQGQLDHELSARGHAQARAAARALIPLRPQRDVGDGDRFDHPTVVVAEQQGDAAGRAVGVTDDEVDDVGGEAQVAQGAGGPSGWQVVKCHGSSLAEAADRVPDFSTALARPTWWDAEG